MVKDSNMPEEARKLLQEIEALEQEIYLEEIGGGSDPYIISFLYQEKEQYEEELEQITW